MIFDFVAFVETNYLITDMCKSESSQSYESDESGVHSVDSSTACSRPRAFNCFLAVGFIMHTITVIVSIRPVIKGATGQFPSPPKFSNIL